VVLVSYADAARSRNLSLCPWVLCLCLFLRLCLCQQIRNILCIMHPVHIYSTHLTTTTRVCVGVVRAVFTCMCNVHIRALTSPPALNLVVLSLLNTVCTCICIGCIQPLTTSLWHCLDCIYVPLSSSVVFFRCLLPLSPSVVFFRCLRDPLTYSHKPRYNDELLSMLLLIPLPPMIAISLLSLSLSLSHTHTPTHVV
jgi:hypothetical protein